MRFSLFLQLALIPVLSFSQNKKQKQEYTKYIATADSAFEAKNYSLAKDKYQLATAIKPNEKHPTSRLLECDKLALVQNQEYKKLVHSGDSCFEKKNWITAKTFYLRANSVKPSESYASDQAKNCNYQIVAKNAMEARYSECIRTGDSCYAARSWSCAKANYEAAQRTKPEESYPKTKIAECDKKIVVAVDKERYAITISDADVQFDAGNYFVAKRMYTEALSFNPAATYPVTRIALCDEKLNAPK